MRALELKIPPVAVFLIFAAAMWALSAKIPAGDFNLPYAAAIATALAVLGLAVAIAGVREFRRHQTTVNPTKPDEASAVVRSSVYRLTRNPMYLGLAGWVLALGLFLQNIAALACLPAFILYMTRFQIRPEERVLQEKFGAEYLDYRREVRRWL